MSKALDMARELVKQLEEAEKSNKVQLSELEVGDIFKIGVHDFIVLEQCSGITRVISKNFMAEEIVFNKVTRVYGFDKVARDYRKSNLKEVIENYIQPVIEAEVGANNLVENFVDLTSVDMQHDLGLYKCKVRPITFGEARKYNNLLVNKSLMDEEWWTCTPWSTAERGWKYSVATVRPTGDLCYRACDASCGVRPVCILKSNIIVSKGE